MKSVGLKKFVADHPLTKKLKRGLKRLAAMTMPKEPLPFSKMQLKPDVEKAFQDAMKPLPPRRETPSVMGSTSKGKNWQPRDRAWFAKVKMLDQKLQKHIPARLRFDATIHCKSGAVYARRHGTVYLVPKFMTAGV